MLLQRLLKCVKTVVGGFNGILKIPVLKLISVLYCYSYEIFSIPKKTQSIVKSNMDIQMYPFTGVILTISFIRAGANCD